MLQSSSCTLRIAVDHAAYSFDVVIVGSGAAEARWPRPTPARRAGGHRRGRVRACEHAHRLQHPRDAIRLPGSSDSDDAAGRRFRFRAQPGRRRQDDAVVECGRARLSQRISKGARTTGPARTADRLQTGRPYYEAVGARNRSLRQSATVSTTCPTACSCRRSREVQRRDFQARRRGRWAPACFTSGKPPSACRPGRAPLSLLRNCMAGVTWWPSTTRQTSISAAEASGSSRLFSDCIVREVLVSGREPGDRRRYCTAVHKR